MYKKAIGPEAGFMSVGNRMQQEERVILPQWPDEFGLGQRAVNVVQTCQQQALPCQYLGTMPLFAEHRVYEGEERDWVMMPLAQDPLFAQTKAYPVPATVLTGLRQINRSGVAFDAIYVAHEVEKGAVVEGQAVSLEAVAPPPPERVQQLSKRLGRVAHTLFTVALAPLFAWSAASVALASAVAAAPLILDPVLLGVVVEPGAAPVAGQLACWFYLAHWRYGGDGHDQAG